MQFPTPDTQCSSVWNLQGHCVFTKKVVYDAQIAKRVGQGIAQLNSSAAKRREAELLLDDSDSDMESDVVFAHIMARQHGGHALHDLLQPAEPPECSATAQVPQLRLRDEAVVRHESSVSPALAGASQGGSGAAATLNCAEKAVSVDSHTDPAAAPEHLSNAQHASSAADYASAGTAEHTAVTAGATETAQQITTETLAATAQVSLLSASEGAASDAGAQPLGSDPSLEGRSSQASTKAAAAAAQVSLPGASGKAASDADVQPFSSGPSLQRSTSQQRGKKPSQKAVAAMWELLESSTAPQLQLDPGAPLPGIPWAHARTWPSFYAGHMICRSMSPQSWHAEWPWQTLG